MQLSKCSVELLCWIIIPHNGPFLVAQMLPMLIVLAQWDQYPIIPGTAGLNDPFTKLYRLFVFTVTQVELQGTSCTALHFIIYRYYVNLSHILVTLGGGDI